MLRKHAPLLTVTLAVVLGAQQIRVLFPSIGWYLRDTEQLGVTDLIPYALAPFALSLLAPVLVWLFRPKIALYIAGIGLFAARLLEQITLEPNIDLWTSMVGVICFLWLLTIMLTRDRNAFVFGVLLGFALDTALKGAARTLEFSWMQSPWGTIVVLLLLAWFVYMLIVTARNTTTLHHLTLRTALPLLAIGTFFFFEWLILNNQGWQATVNGWSLSLTLFFLVISNIAAIWLAAYGPVWLSTKPFWLRAIVVLLAVLVMWQSSQLLSFVIVLGTIAAGLVLAVLVDDGDSAETDRNIWATGIVLGISWLLFAGLALMYYMALELALPLAMSDLPVVAAIILAICAVIGVYRLDATVSDYTFPLAAATVLLIIPILLLVIDLVSPQPEPPSADKPLTVMTYNIHSGMGIDGANGLERVADNIEASGADVVGFQELSRGWILDGSVEMLGWMSHRLDMPYMAFVPTVDDPLWGNAILSKYPLDNVETGLLPALGTLIGRGFVSAEIDTGSGEPVLFYSTHLQHKGNDDYTKEEIHFAQLEVILDHWNNRPHTILVGDFNAEPDWPQMELVLHSGFVDSWAEAGNGPGYTANARDPQHRIDWVFHTPDITATNAVNIESVASDHFPVVVETNR
ncbi:MAG: endonuclease/exonuclease/phosphatase family protein [Anaerolineae bacterium]|nr:endonuclease/exonuclease/phosphatase family protein [Anaerolineae bacterium]